MATYTTDLCDGGTATTSYFSPGYPVSQLFDNNLETGWSTGNGSNSTAWVKYDFGVDNAKQIEKYTIENWPSATDYDPNSWTLQGSNNDSDWVTVDTQSSVTWEVGPPQTKKEFIMVNGNSYRYYKFNFVNANSALALVLREIEMMEEIVVNIPPVANPNRPDNIAELYHTKQIRLRGKAEQGFVRPTVAQFFTSKNFEEIISNNPPVANPDSAECVGNSSVIIDLLANDADPENDVLTIINLVTPTHGALVNHGDGTVTYTPTVDYIGDDTFDYTINDGFTDVTSTVSITVVRVPTIVGTLYEGGYYIGTLGSYALVCSPAEGAGRERWGKFDVVVPGADSLTDGKQNTIDLISHGGHDVAIFCNNLTIGGFSDWYLPATEEFLLLAANSVALEAAGLEFTKENGYWTSTEYTAMHAGWGPITPFGNVVLNAKAGSYYVRAIRRVAI